ncbi:MAG: ABC transporter ATP-binding protein [Gemmatimonadetes bacterium]|nr:MAG: ABC transporter ATP-binding protein [Gemmatimonadota bacterium]
MIELQHVTKRFGDLTAVDNLNLSIPKGEFFGFLGQNGAGKTTTIKMMTGLLRPTEGTILIDGINIQQEPEKAKFRIGYVPDSPYVYEKLTGREFLYFTGNLYRLDQETIRRRTDYFLDLFELQDAADKRTEEYSHGMRQKIVMSSAFIHLPRVMIVDEPMVGLDPQSAKMIKSILRKLCDDQGSTVFMSSHSLPVVEELCDRIGIIVKGRLIALGTLDELKAQARLERGMTLEHLFLELTGGVKEANLID